MTIDFITGKAGTDHIDGDDWRGMNASMVGLDDYVMKLRNQLAITVQDSNHVVIDTGMAMMNGGAANVTAAETVTVQSGTQGQKRNDLIVLRYTRTNSIEKAQLVCLRGTPTTGTPADPSYNRQSILLGSTTVHDMPLYRLPLNGITLGTPVKLFRTLDSLASVWDSMTSAKPVIARNYFPQTMTIEGVRVGSFAMLHVQGGGVNTNAEQDTAIAMLEEAAKPKVPVVTLFGMNGNAWGMISVNPNGAVNVMHRYVSGNIVWSNIDISVAWVTA